MREIGLCRALLLVFLLPAPAGAQQVRGVVVEDSTFRPLSGVKIELISNNTTTAISFSNVTGWFELSPESAGQYLLRASHPAYQTVDVRTVTFRPQEMFTVVLRLRGGPIPLEALVVQGTARDRTSGYRERARRAAFGRFITREQIDKLGAYSMSHALRLTPEVRIERVRDGPFTTQGIFMRSFGDLCVPAIYLDGVPIPTGPGFDIDALLSAEAVEGIEVYRSALSAPMEFRMSPFMSPNNLCGVVAVWSRVLPGPPPTLLSVLYTAALIGSSLLVLELIR